MNRVLLDVAISKNKAIRATVKTTADRETGKCEQSSDGQTKSGDPKDFWTNAGLSEGNDGLQKLLYRR